MLKPHANSYAAALLGDHTPRPRLLCSSSIFPRSLNDELNRVVKPQADLADGFELVFLDEARDHPLAGIVTHRIVADLRHPLWIVAAERSFFIGDLPRRTIYASCMTEDIDQGVWPLDPEFDVPESETIWLAWAAWNVLDGLATGRLTRRVERISRPVRKRCGLSSEEVVIDVAPPGAPRLAPTAAPRIVRPVTDVPGTSWGAKAYETRAKDALRR